MRVPATMVAGLLLAAGCAIGPTEGTPAGTSIVDGQAHDDAFRLTIHAERPTYRTGEAIGTSATLTYFGPEPAVDVVGSGSGLVGFGLRQLDGQLKMGPGWLDSCRTYPMSRGTAVAVPFVKSGGFIPTDPDGPFWQAYFAERDLLLPAGTWQIDAVLEASLGSCGGERHSLTASVVIGVEP